MTLAACCLSLVPWFVKAWCLKLLAVDHDPGTELGPTIAHDLELSCDGLQLARASVTNVYFELFHVFILLFNCVCFRALAA